MAFSKPGDLIKASRNPKMKGAVIKHLKHKGFNVGKVKHTGSFHGKSNALGQGGRAAQLKARGVPGGVIGMMARAAHAAPGQANYHKKSGKKSVKKGAIASNMGMASKGKKHKKSVRGIKSTGFRSKHSASAVKGLKEFANEEAREKSSHKCKGSMCKNASHKGKKAKKA